MNILVAYAVQPEFDPWQKLRKFGKIATGGFTIHRTEIGRATVDFVVSGMGPSRAQGLMEAVASPKYAVVIASGLAGSLRSDLAVAEVVAPATVRRTETADSLSCDAALIAEGISVGAKGIETIVSSERIATTPAEKAQLGGSGDAVDMESFAVVSAAQRLKIPAVVIRAISDRHDQALPVDLSAAVDERGQISIGHALKMVAGNPGHIASLMKLGRDSKAAAEALARFLDRYIERISGILKVC
jgi:nucleoside phosphorylase